MDAPNTAVLELDKLNQVFLLHVPGTLTFAMTGKREHQLHLEFGFMPGAYTGEGHTAGADYVVELLRVNEPQQELFRRTPAAGDSRRRPWASVSWISSCPP